MAMRNLLGLCVTWQLAPAIRSSTCHFSLIGEYQLTVTGWFMLTGSLGVYQQSMFAPLSRIQPCNNGESI